MCTISRYAIFLHYNINKLVRPRWPYDMRPSARAEKYISWPISENRSFSILDVRSLDGSTIK